MNGILFIAGMLWMTQISIARPFYEGKNKYHKVVVQEVIQTTNYTYLHGKEDDSDRWLAVPSMDAQTGSTYYYGGGLPMRNFQSKELHRTFDLVLFLGKVSEMPPDQPAATHEADTHHTDAQPYQRKAAAVVKKELKIERAADGITIAELFAKKDAYAGKTVKIKGQVIKYNASIMDKNWVHLQDGTETDGKFDLVVTTGAEVKVDDIVTLEGVITLNKDFGYGYSFDVIMEDAKVK